MNALYERPVFLLGCHKSGTSLLRSLLDGHSQLFSLPKESHFFQASGLPVSYPFRSQIGANQSELFSLKGYENFLLKENSQRIQFSDNREFMYDVDSFSEKYQAQVSDGSLKAKFIRYENSIIESSGLDQDFSQTSLVEKSVEHMEFFPLLFNMFPAARFIHIIRNPYAVVSATRQMKFVEKYPLILPIITALGISFQSSVKNNFFPAQYLVLKYENLVRKPKAVLDDVCAFLRIEFENIMLSPTVGGKAWGGNSVSMKEFSAVSAERANAWESEINGFEIAMVNRYLAHYLRHFGYVSQRGENPYRPIRNESLKTYVLNRFHLRAADTQKRCQP